MLDSHARVMAFQDVCLDAPAFLRPIEGSKYFASRVFDVQRWVSALKELESRSGAGRIA